MEIIKEICKNNFKKSEPEEGKDSPENVEQSGKCQKLYEELSETLTEEQKKKLLELDMEYFMLGGQWKDDGFKEGSEKGFKLAVRLLLESLS